jgi:hypothetical protein
VCGKIQNKMDSCQSLIMQLYQQTPKETDQKILEELISKELILVKLLPLEIKNNKLNKESLNCLKILIFFSKGDLAVD